MQALVAMVLDYDCFHLLLFVSLLFFLIQEDTSKYIHLYQSTGLNIKCIHK